jgi:hypothetical protein
MLIGSDLLNKVTEMQQQNPPASASDIVRECGYVKDNGKLNYTEFYTALLTEKGLLPSQDSDSKVSEENQDLYDELCNRYGDDAVDAFLELYDENDLSNFEDCYQGAYDSEADFAERFTTDVYASIPDYIVVDWEATWNSNLAYDYDFQDGFVFSNNW